MNDYKPYKQLKQKQKAKVVERIYKELHQFFSDNQRFPDTESQGTVKNFWKPTGSRLHCTRPQKPLLMKRV